jgi:hypothetical protein
VTGALVTGALVGDGVTGALVTGALVGDGVTGALVTGALVGDGVTGAFVTGALVGDGVTGALVGALVGESVPGSSGLKHEKPVLEIGSGKHSSWVLHAHSSIPLTPEHSVPITTSHTVCKKQNRRIMLDGASKVSYVFKIPLILTGALVGELVVISKVELVMPLITAVMTFPELTWMVSLRVPSLTIVSNP